jgi:hypothetical protein
MLLALILAAAQPWLSMEAGPMLLREGSGLGSGPLVRVSVGQPAGDRLAGELWLMGALESAPVSAPGDRALLGGGVGGRLLLYSFGSDEKVGLWARVGVGWAAPAAGGGGQGPSAFGGALLTFQPFVKRFSLGLEADAVAFRTTYGLALLPSLRCSF